MEILWLLLGTFLGGFVSWIISHNYYNKNLVDNNIFKDISVYGTAKSDILSCWETITKPENKKYFTVTHSFGNLNPDEEIGVGTVQEMGGFLGSKFKEVISAWEPPIKLAWGTDKENWHHFIELKKSGEHTTIFLRRRFWIRPEKWQNVLMDKIFFAQKPITEYNLTQDTLKRLIAIFEGRPT